MSPRKKDNNKENLIRVDIIALVEDQENESPIVVLHDVISNRLLPIWIGDAEARAIAISLNKMMTPRPLTHSLLVNVIEKMGGKIKRVAIDRITKHTYFASIYVELGEKGGEEIKIDARPSDSIALALEANVPVFVASGVMLTASQPNPIEGIAMEREQREIKPLRIEDFKKEDIEKLREHLEKARQREQGNV